MIEHDPFVSEFSHERHRPREAEALQTLQKVASVVKPIMRQRGWHVGTLAEFYPPERNLLGLNWNHGQKICLRLRYPGDERQFMPFEGVVDTMLHELCHIVHGPHNEAFHALWTQLRDEHESLLRKGYTGEGFLSTGHKLGGGRIPMHEARRRARAAAEQRKTLSAGSGQKLGGAPVRRGADMRRVIADAAQRRNEVTRGCAGSGGVAGDEDRRRQIVEETSRNGFRTKAEEDDANERAIMEAYIELVQEDERQKYGGGYLPPSQANPLGGYGGGKAADVARAELATSRPPAVPTRTKPLPSQKAAQPQLPQRSLPQTRPPTVPLQEPTWPSPPAPAPPTTLPDTWTCDICTLNNPPSFLICDACGTDRPYSSKSSDPPSSSSNPSPSISSSRFKPAPKPATDKFTPSHTIDRQIRRARSARALDKLASLREAEQEKPLGWLCGRCGTFMETEWWTCASCGAVKTSS